MTRRRADPLVDRDLALVRRAGRRSGWVTAGLVTAGFALCAGVVFAVVATGQDRDERAQLAASAAHADDVGDPPDGTSLALRRPDGRIEVTPGAPAVLPYRPDIAAVLAPGGPATVLHDVDTPAGEVRIYTRRRPDRTGTTVAQAAAPLAPLQAERARLLGGLLAAGAVALLAAAALGTLAGRRSAHGLVTVLRRQRQFVADASHELRTPLTVLSTRAQLLSRHLAAADVDERTRAVLAADVDRLLADSGGLADVVDDLLAASEPETDGPGWTDLPALAADAVASLAPLGAERGVTLRAGVLPGAPPEGDLLVAAGQAPLRRCLVALADNAIRHTPRGGSVTVACGLRGGRGLVAVTDTGPGIPPASRAHLFDRFASGDGGSGDAVPGHAGPGGRRRYGLGLALVADTVHRFGGDITVDSGPAGSTFTLALPLHGDQRRRRPGRLLRPL